MNQPSIFSWYVSFQGMYIFITMLIEEKFKMIPRISASYIWIHCHSVGPNAQFQVNVNRKAISLGGLLLWGTHKKNYTWTYFFQVICWLSALVFITIKSPFLQTYFLLVQTWSNYPKSKFHSTWQFFSTWRIIPGLVSGDNHGGICFGFFVLLPPKFQIRGLVSPNQDFPYN